MVINKSDQPLRLSPEVLIARYGLPVAVLSARTGEGLDNLRSAVQRLYPQGESTVPGELLTNARQADAARRALTALEASQSDLAAGYTPDAVLTNVEDALSALGELTGRTLRSDITDRIFSRFCVGK